MKLRHLVLLACLLTRPVLGMEALIQDVLYQDMGDHVQLNVHLGMAVDMTRVTWTDPRTLSVSLDAREPGSRRNWNSMELDFDEPDRLLRSVFVGGNDVKGYQLEIRLARPVSSQLLPQFQDNQVLLKIVDRPNANQLDRLARAKDAASYAVELEARPRGIPSLEDIPKGFARTHALYFLVHENDGVTWERLRLGFFTEQAAAERTARSLQRFFPDASALAVGTAETELGQAMRINPSDQVASLSPRPREEMADEVAEVQLSVALSTPSSIGALPADREPQPNDWSTRERLEPEPPSELEQLLEKAEEAFAEEDYRAATALYDKLFNAGQEPFRQQALEMLGVARELNDQPAHAKRYYQTYLADYPETDGSKRVDQRLAALIAFDQPRSPTRMPAARGADSRFDAQLSQFYQRQRFEVDDQASVPIDGLFNDFNVRYRRDGTMLEQEVRTTLSYLADFTDNERLDGREVQVSTAYWEGRLKRLDTEARIGRQSRWDSGALGRFDGASFGYRPTDSLLFGMTGGYLIDASYDSPGSNRPFFGLHGEYVSRSGRLLLKPFYVQQYADGLLDRRAIGMQSQLFTERAMFFSLIDYDLHHSALNNFTLTGNLTFGRSQLNASYEHRMNPYLTTRNALMGQGMEDLSELEEAILDLSLDELAADRTATSDTVRVGLNYRLSDNWTLNADVVASEFSPTESSADVAGLESHSALYSTFQIRSAELFGRGSYSSVMIRVADSQTSATTSLYWDNRFLFGSRWYLYPRIRFDQRTFQRSDDEQWSIRPSLRLDFRMTRRIRFEIESGYEWTTREMEDRDLDINGLFVRAGYRASL